MIAFGCGHMEGTIGELQKLWGATGEEAIELMRFHKAWIRGKKETNNNNNYNNKIRVKNHILILVLNW